MKNLTAIVAPTGLLHTNRLNNLCNGDNGQRQLGPRSGWDHYLYDNRGSVSNLQFSSKEHARKVESLLETVLDYKFWLLVLEKENKLWCNISEYPSEGVQWLIRIFYACTKTDISTPEYILIEDVEFGLHPKTQRRLIETLQNLSKDIPIFVTTNSPYLLDAVPAANVIVVTCKNQGFPNSVRLSDHPKWETFSMSSGEFWTWVGEDWVGKDS